MLIAQKYLEQFIEVTDSVEEISRKFNNYGGLEVEEVFYLVPQKAYVVGEIIAIEKHEDADKLNVCTVDVGNETLQIVCGAPNVRLNAFVIVALVGTTMPDGMTIEKRMVRGVDSVGMICSLQEIGLDDKYIDDRYKTGVYLFEDTAVQIGGDVLEALGFDTPIFDLSVTPNRADALSYRGVVYEVAALCDKPVKKDMFVYDRPQGSFPINEHISSLNVSTNRVVCYNLISFTQVKIQPSPLWLQSFLIVQGIRPINNIVDITNYVMLILGIPLHAFDRQKLPSDVVSVRQAFDEEALVTLDGKNRHLTSEDIIITSGDLPIALAGVMGGQNSEIDETTSEVLLECAIFDPLTVRKTATKFNLRSDASQRYEKGVDATIIPMVIALASSLFVELASAVVSSDELTYEVLQPIQPTITFDHKALVQKIGTEVTVTEVERILERLHYEIDIQSESYAVCAPPWRQDIQLFEDVVEEVVRLYGFENLPSTLPFDMSRPVFASEAEELLKQLHHKLHVQGLNEVVSYTLLTEQKATLGQYQQPLEPLTIPHPLTHEKTTLRTTTYYSMIDLLTYHKNRSFSQAFFYEITTVYGKNNQTKELLSIGAYGTPIDQKLYNRKDTMDFHLMKGVIESLCTYIPKPLCRYQASQNELFHPGVSADLYILDQYIGSFGRIHPLVAKTLDVSEDLYVAELDVQRLLQLEQAQKKDKPRYQMVSKYPDSERDLAFVVDRDLSIGSVVKVVQQHAGQYCTSIDVFDVYMGDHVEVTKKSIALRIQFNNSDETLTSDYIDQVIEKIIQQVKDECSGTLR